MKLRNKALKSAIAWSGLKYQDLANRVGVKENDISLFVTGRKQPTINVAERIAEALNTEKEKLFSFMIEEGE